MDKKTLLSIGKLSKLTGVHIKSLRYYDRLGILRPAYVDKDSGYRYYAFAQVYLVEAIQLCVELDIPLKRFTDFLADGDHQVAYEKLLAFGTKLATEKMSAIQDKLAFLENGKRQIAESKSIAAGSFERTMPAMDLICVPIQGKPGIEQCYDLIGNLFTRLESEGLKHGYEIGLLSRYRGETAEHFAFVEVIALEGAGMSCSGLFRLPAMHYVAAIIDDSDGISHAADWFPERFRTNDDKIVMQTDLFQSVYDVTAPKYELRCSAFADGFEKPML